MNKVNKLKLGLVLLGSLSLLLGFQNCSEVEFKDAGALVEKVDHSDNDDSDLLDSEGSDEIAENDDEGTSDDSDTDPIADETDSENSSGDDQIQADESKNRGNSSGNRGNSAKGDRQYICILEGPGKSVRLGYLNGALMHNGRTPQTVCMSQAACLDIVSQSYDVKGAVQRGFCKSGDSRAHTIELSDEDISDLIENRI